MSGRTTYKQTSIRLSEDTIEKADELIEPVQQHDFYGSLGVVRRADVLRLALTKGLELLRDELLDENKKK